MPSASQAAETSSGGHGQVAAAAVPDGSTPSTSLNLPAFAPFVAPPLPIAAVPSHLPPPAAAACPLPNQQVVPDDGIASSSTAVAAALKAGTGASAATAGPASHQNVDVDAPPDSRPDTSFGGQVASAEASSAGETFLLQAGSSSMISATAEQQQSQQRRGGKRQRDKAGAQAGLHAPAAAQAGLRAPAAAQAARLPAPASAADTKANAVHALDASPAQPDGEVNQSEHASENIFDLLNGIPLDNDEQAEPESSFPLMCRQHSSVSRINSGPAALPANKNYSSGSSQADRRLAPSCPAVPAPQNPYQRNLAGHHAARDTSSRVPAGILRNNPSRRDAREANEQQIATPADSQQAGDVVGPYAASNQASSRGRVLTVPRQSSGSQAAQHSPAVHAQPSRLWVPPHLQGQPSSSSHRQASHVPHDALSQPAQGLMPHLPQEAVRGTVHHVVKLAQDTQDTAGVSYMHSPKPQQCHPIRALDGRAYEEEPIKDWLNKHQTCPANRIPMQADALVALPSAALIFMKKLTRVLSVCAQEGVKHDPDYAHFFE